MVLTKPLIIKQPEASKLIRDWESAPRSNSRTACTAPGSYLLYIEPFNLERSNDVLVATSYWVNQKSVISKNA